MSPWIELAMQLQQQIPNSLIIQTSTLTGLNIYKNGKRTRETKPYAKITIYPDHILATSWNTIPHRQRIDLTNPDSLPTLQTWLQQIGIHIQI